MTNDAIQARLDRLESLVEQQRKIIEEQGERLDQLDSKEIPDEPTGRTGVDTGPEPPLRLLTSGGQPTKIIGTIADDDGIGVWGEANGGGTTYGVRGDSPDGYGLYTPDATRLDGALVGDSLTGGESVTDLLGSGIDLDDGALTTTYFQPDEPATAPAGTFWVTTPGLESVDSYDDGDEIGEIASESGYVFAGDANQEVHRFELGDLSSGPESTYKNNYNITAIEYGDGFIYVGEENNKLVKIIATFTESTSPIDSYDANATVNDVAYGDEGFVYAGIGNGEVVRLDSENLSDGPTDSYDHDENSPIPIHAIEYGDDGYVYAGGQNNLVHKFTADSLGSGPLESYDAGGTIRAIEYGDDGYLYAGGLNDKVQKFDPGNLSAGPEDSYDGQSILTITYGVDGYLYAGGTDAEVYKLDTEDLSDGPKDSYEVSGSSVYALAYGDDRYIYAGANVDEGLPSLEKINTGTSLSVSTGDEWISLE